jgi:hypothetical protein
LHGGKSPQLPAARHDQPQIAHTGILFIRHVLITSFTIVFGTTRRLVPLE